VLQCVAVCCSVLQCVAVCCSVLQCVAVRSSVLQCAAVCCSVKDELTHTHTPAQALAHESWAHLPRCLRTSHTAHTYPHATPVVECIDIKRVNTLPTLGEHSE